MTITANQAYEIKRLAQVMTVRRVRRFAVHKGTAGPNETVENTERSLNAARAEFETYVDALITPQFEGNGNDFIEP